jgi:chromosome partitioning protein
VSNLKNEYDYILIDGCPQNGQLAISSIKAADVVLIPVTPSPYDAWACSKLVELIKSRQEITEGVPITRFLISRSIKNTLLDVDVRKILDEYGIEILKSQTTQRQVYPQVAALGKTVFWSSNKNACNEIDSIRKEVERLALFSS